MGGNALKNIVTRRYSKDEYFAYFKKIEGDFESLFGPGSVKLIPAYKDKDSFGDMDLLFSPNIPRHQLWLLEAEALVVNFYGLKKNQYHKNGNVFSFAPHDFQIDLIGTDVHSVDAALNYFAYNDMSNLLGRLTHKLGIKLGHSGLSIVVRSPTDDSNILSEIELSKNYSDALDILGLSAKRYDAGFNSLEDIFEFVASSKFFNRDVFLLDNRNHIGRTRDRKRPTYSKFLEWIEETNPSNNYIFEEKNEGGYGLREPFFSEIVLKRYPFVEQKVIDLVKKDLVNRNFKKQFNGVIVGAMTGLSGKALGAFMSSIKFSELERHIINEDMVKAKVKSALNK